MLCNESVLKEEPDTNRAAKFSLNMTFVSDFAGWMIHGKMYHPGEYTNPALKEILEKINLERQREITGIRAQKVFGPERKRLLKEAQKRHSLARSSAIDAFNKETTDARKESDSKDITNQPNDEKVSNDITKDASEDTRCTCMYSYVLKRCTHKRKDFYKDQEMFAIIISVFHYCLRFVPLQLIFSSRAYTLASVLDEE